VGPYGQRSQCCTAATVGLLVRAWRTPSGAHLRRAPRSEVRGGRRLPPPGHHQHQPEGIPHRRKLFVVPHMRKVNQCHQPCRAPRQGHVHSSSPRCAALLSCPAARSAGYRETGLHQLRSEGAKRGGFAFIPPCPRAGARSSASHHYPEADATAEKRTGTALDST
jgi:hypothetical protein